MKKKHPIHIQIRRLAFSGVFLALALALPFLTGQIPQIGSALSPMHIPVLLCGLICGWQYGLLCGIAGPLVSALITGMPPAAVLPGMLVECAAYGALTGLMMQLVHTKKVYPDLYISLLVAMLGGRIISGIAKALIFSAGSYSMTAWVTGSFVTSLPGIIVHLVLIPSIVYALMKAKLIPARY